MTGLRPPPAPVKWSARQYLLAFAATAGISLIIAIRNYYGTAMAGRPQSWWVVLVSELPVWLPWVLLLPVINTLAVRYPPVGSRAARNAVLHVIAALITCFIVLMSQLLVRAMIPDIETPRPSQPGFWNIVWQGFFAVSLGYLFIYSSVVGLMLAWIYHRSEQERRTRESQLEATLARTERDLLRMQIHPHFLFNTLHAISALVLEDPQGARRMVVRLSDLLRLSLDDDARHEVSLADELEFLARYLDIQRIRFGDRLAYVEHVTDDARSRLLPRLLLQPLVENAIRHGIERLEDGGSIVLDARVEDESLVVVITNDGPPPAEARRSTEGAGVGLRNSRARLAQLYSGSASLELASRPEGGAVVTVRIPLQATLAP